MVTPRKPWVSIAAAEYYNLTSDTETLIYLSKTLFEKAVFGRHNPVLLEKIISIMPVKLGSFKQQVRLANSKRRRQHGRRYPKWVVTALEEGLVIATIAEQSLNIIEEAYLDDDWDRVESETAAIYNNILQIQEYLLSGPPPTVIEEIGNIAETFWQRWVKNYE